ncbi:MAG: DNA-binding protein [Lachnospiraceae bacterium]|nr:DNA-binding protein [Lachnospiraceae bacterium]
MYGTIWMFSDMIDDEDILFAMRSFITYKMAVEYYDMSMKAVTRTANQSGAVYKLHKKVLIKRSIFEDFLRKYGKDGRRIKNVR